MISNKVETDIQWFRISLAVFADFGNSICDQTELLLDNGLTYLNTKFQERKGKIWTYTYANNPKAQIDCILTDKKWIYCALNCETYSTFQGASSDHRIVTVKIHVSLYRIPTQTTKTMHSDWSLLNNRDISNKYTIWLTNKFNALPQRYQKHIHRMTNMRTSSSPTWKQLQNAYQLN